MKHTPEPWRILGHDHSGMNRISIMSGENEVAGVVNIPDSGFTPDNKPVRGLYKGTGEANAHLIAAAPELMEAAKEVLQQLDSYVSEGRKGAGLKRFAGWFCVSDLRAAIAKAT